MKRVIPVILFVFLITTVTVQGQFIESVGLKAGISLANQSHQITPIDYTLETDHVTGPAAGIFMEAFRGRHFGFQSDLAFVTKGSKTTTQSVTVNHLENDKIIVNEGDLKVSKFYYLCLSPMARYRINLERITPYALLGPRVDFLLKYKTDSDYPLEEQNKVIPGLTGGLGVEFDLNGLGVLFELQYQSDIMPVTGKDPLLINNNILLFTLGIRYLNVK
jgi:hypothetical protein